MTVLVPVEIQVHILKLVIDGIEDLLPLCGTLEWGRFDTRSPTRAFLDAASASSSTSLKFEHLPTRPICKFDDPLLLRAALAASLPAWRGALRHIPELWSRIAVSLKEETWNMQVDAVKEALQCARRKPLAILITHVAIDGDLEGVEGQNTLREESMSRKSSVEEYKHDCKESERARVSQIMALLTPHIAQWYYFRVCTLHPGALPIPTIDFGGDAPLLQGLHLHATRSVPASGSPAPTVGETQVLHVQNLSSLTIEGHAFRVAFLGKPNALPAVCNLKLWGPGIVCTSAHVYSAIGPPAMSLRALLDSLKQMTFLAGLSLDGVHLDVGQCDIGTEATMEGEDDESIEASASIFWFRHMECLHCERLTAEALGQVLDLVDHMLLTDLEFEEQAEDDESYMESYDRLRDIEIVGSPLPNLPRDLENFNRIWLMSIPVGENYSRFLGHTSKSTTLGVARCPDFSVEILAEPPANQTWLLPELWKLSVDESKVRAQALRQVMCVRKEAADAGQDVSELQEVTLDDRWIGLHDDDSGDSGDHEDHHEVS